MLEHDQEHEPGIPEPLPDNETMLWQGAPDFRSLAVGSFRIRTLAVYFGALLVLQFGLSVAGKTPVGDAIGTTAGYSLLALVALGIVAGYARLVARSSLFTITDRRVVIRTGVALPVTINLPYRLIESAELRLHGDDSGDISLLPARGNRVSWLLVWPMVKPWRFLRVRPVLRGIADARSVAETLADALRRAAEAPGPAVRVVQDGDAAERDTGADRLRWRPYPTVPLAAGVALVSFSLIAVAWNQLTDTVDAATPVPFVSQVDLYFEDQADGSVVVRNAADGGVVDTLEPGTNGFVRATLRGLVRARDALNAGSEEPFTVGQTDAGEIYLFDPVSDRRIDLRAFGQENSQAFTRFLFASSMDARVSDADADGENDGDRTVALRDNH